MDYFYEQLITTKKSMIYMITRIFFFVFIAIAIIFITSFNLLGFIMGGIFACLAVAFFFLKQKLYVEFEYVITNGSVDIDRIVEANKRKRLIEFNIKDVELLGREDSDEVKSFQNKPDKKLDCITSGNNDKIYAAYLTLGAERCIIRFTPDQKFLDICFKYNPRGVKR